MTTKGFKKYHSVTKIEKKYFREALMLSYRIWLLHFLVPYKKLELKYACSGSLLIEPNTCNNVKKAIQRASMLTFWKNQCLIQTFVARKMLNRRNIQSTAYLGLIKVDDSKYNAHAWLIASDIEVVASNVNCTQIHTF